MSINAPRRGNLFETIKITEPKKSAFDMSFENKLTSNMGYLIPTLCKEVLPGDYLELRSSSLVRFAPTLAPVLHNIDVCTYTFFVPNRLIWPNWQKFITPGDGTVTMQNAPTYVPPISPYMTLQSIGDNGYVGDGTLTDYLGLPSNIDSESSKNVRISALPFRAYHLIYDEYFRDQNVTEPTFNPEVDFTDGEIKDSDMISTLTTLKKKCWEKDYFTSALPTAQRGPVVMLPIGTSADLVMKDSTQLAATGEWVNPQNLLNIRLTDFSTGIGPNNFSLYGYEDQVASAKDLNNQNVTATPKADLGIGSLRHVHKLEASELSNLITKGFKVDLSSASSATVETLRNAFKLQEFFEKSARSGARYIESILAHFGTKSSDARLQRPELLGTSRNPVNVSDIAQTSQTDGETSPTGTLYGKLTSSYHNDTIRYSAEEHGFLMQLQCVIPRTAYFQGINRMWTRETYLDYAWPEFAHLGEQEVYNYELYNDSNSTSKPNDIFGYQPRYAEYKYNSDEVHGDFRGNLSYWHLARKFTSQPTLSTEFMECSPSYDIFAVTDESVHHLYQEIWHDFKMIRCLPEYGTPHF